MKNRPPSIQNQLSKLRALAHQPPNWSRWCQLNSMASSNQDVVVLEYAKEALSRWPTKYQTWNDLMDFQFAHVHPNSFGCGVIERQVIQQDLLSWVGQRRKDGWRPYKSSRLGLKDGRELLLHCQDPIIRELDSYLETHFHTRFAPWMGPYDPKQHSHQRRLRDDYDPQRHPSPWEWTGEQGAYHGFFRGLGQFEASPPNDGGWPLEDLELSAVAHIVLGWQELKPPHRMPHPEAETLAFFNATPTTVEQYIELMLKWNINNTFTEIAKDEHQEWQITEAYDLELSAEQEKIFTGLFLSHLRPNTRFFAGHLSAHNFIHTGYHDDDLASDLALTAVDDEHIRLFWSNKHRRYG